MDPVTAICTGTNLHRLPPPAGHDAERAHAAVAWALYAKEDQLKLSPQAHELPALGLSMVKPCFSIVSAKSMVAPSR
jgi:hypothetical protein